MACNALVFRKSNAFVCALLSIAIMLTIIVLIFFAWIPAVACRIKQLLHRLRNCREGNSNPNIPL